MRVIPIVMLSSDGFLSQGQGVPWHLPKDKARFRALTHGRALLLGRRTYEEMLGWFDEHLPLVLTHRSIPEGEPGRAVGSIAEATAAAAEAGHGELWVIGGSGAYEEAWPQVTHLEVTWVEAPLGRGVAFPPIGEDQWAVIADESHPADAEHGHAFRFVSLERRSNAPF